MKTTLNYDTLLWALGIIQPATSKEVWSVYSMVLDRHDARPSRSRLENELKRQALVGRILCVAKTPAPLYSLTYAGHLAMPSNLRKLRDKTRLFLLHKARRAKISKSRGVRESELAGDAPAVDTSSAIKEAAANNSSGRRPKWSVGQPNYWPRPSERFVYITGPKAPPRDIHLRLLSFESEEQLLQACAFAIGPAQFNLIGTAIALGISPALISQILHRPERHYRVFKLPKKGGGQRTIESPRIFLKTLQGFLADYVLYHLKIHDAVHSFRHDRSIVTNASVHEGKRYVASVDIKNFFNSVSKTMVTDILLQNGFRKEAAEFISQICTKQDRLPQEAPTSPILSNAILFNFDSDIEAFCVNNSVTYSRYADDIVFSGDDLSSIKKVLLKTEELLRVKQNLSLNKKKTRIASRGGQQRVTGVVVNVQSAPPRLLRRQIRAMIHNAQKAKTVSPKKFLEIAGYVNYLNAFPKYSGSEPIAQYKKALASLSRLNVSSVRKKRLPKR